MKRNLLCIVALALAAVLCTGCGVKDEDLKSDPLVNPDGTAPVGKTLVAPAPPEGFTLLDNKDILAANGLYYASWVNGEPQPYENSEGKTVDLYDAQLTLVVQENKTEEKATSAVSGWQELAQQNYDISDCRRAGVHCHSVYLSGREQPLCLWRCRLWTEGHQCHRVGAFLSGELHRRCTGCTDRISERLHLLRRRRNGLIFSE